VHDVKVASTGAARVIMDGLVERQFHARARVVAIIHQKH